MNNKQYRILMRAAVIAAILLLCALAVAIELAL